MWAKPKEDLRFLINDGPTDHERKRKRLNGQSDGSNTVYDVFEKRLVSNLVAPSGAEGVFVDNVLVAVTSQDAVIGQVTLTAAPGAGAAVEATYFFQWYTDEELDTFLRSASNWLGKGDDFSMIEGGLQPAAKYYAAQEALHKLSVRFADSLSDVFLMEEGPKEKKVPIVTHFRNLSNDYNKKAKELRDNFYKGQGQAEGPIFASIAGRVSQVVPRR